MQSRGRASRWGLIGGLGLWIAVAQVGVAGSITAALDRTEGGVGDLFQLSVIVEGDGSDDLQIPEVEGLTITRQGTSQSMSIINGAVRKELTWTYLVQAAKPGTYTIPRLQATLDGKVESTLPLTITIESSSASTQQASNSRKKQTSGVKDLGIFVERACDKTQAYIGEPLVCTIRLYHRGNLVGGQRLGHNSSDYRRFMVEGEKQYQTVVKGQRYAVIEMKEILIPTKAGSLDIAPFELDAKVLSWSRRNNPLDKFFDRLGGGMLNFDLSFTEEQEARIASEPTQVTVRDLPATGRPADFSGLVGEYQLSGSKTVDRLGVGDTVTINLTLEGRGPLDSADLAPHGLETIGRIYADKPEYKEAIDGEQGIRSKKTFRYALVPSQTGTHTLPPIEVSIFNPKLGQYLTLRADLGTLIVDPAKGEQKPLVVGGGGTAGSPSKEAVLARDQDLLGLHRTADFEESHEVTRPLALGLLSLTGTSLGLPLLSLLLIYRRSRETGASRRKSQALKVFRTQLDRSLEAAHADQMGDALSLALEAFRAYLGDKFGHAGKSLAEREIGTLLKSKKLGEASLGTVLHLVQVSEKAAFGGRAPDRETTIQILNQWGKLVGEIEKL